jgi:hypothetical protein
MGGDFFNCISILAWHFFGFFLWVAAGAGVPLLLAMWVRSRLRSGSSMAVGWEAVTVIGTDIVQLLPEFVRYSVSSVSALVGNVCTFDTKDICATLNLIDAT